LAGHLLHQLHANKFYVTIHHRALKATTNPEKIQAILTMGKPAKLHDVQKLAGRVAALSRFVARLGKKALSFYALMKKSDNKFEWIEEADAAFAQLKKVLSTPQVLVAPKEREHCYYISRPHIK
jgi:hypothetical protein